MQRAMCATEIVWDEANNYALRLVRDPKFQSQEIEGDNRPRSLRARILSLQIAKGLNSMLPGHVTQGRKKNAGFMTATSRMEVGRNE